MNIDQEFEPYCEGCEHLDIEGKKIMRLDGKDLSIITCSHIDLCRRLWQKWSDTYGTDNSGR